MISPNELRIGNLVLNDENKLSMVRQVSTIGTVLLKGIEYSNEVYEWSQHCNKISGIELSSDILIKAGFKETIESREGQYHRYELDINGLNFMFEIYGSLNPEFYLCMVGVELSFVHQLQNLYQILTGTELHINI